jgi:hypothetical protein
MDNSQSKQSRRGFVGWTLGTLGLFGILKFLPGNNKKEAPVKTIKMLGQDGKLVEIDASLIHRKKTKISEEEVLTWVKK